MTRRAFACSLTSAELQQRKATIIQDLKSILINKEELEYGYAYKFDANDEVIDLLSEFVKVERKCCNFFHFQIAINSQETVLSITGEPEAKDFLVTELDF